MPSSRLSPGTLKRLLTPKINVPFAVCAPRCLYTSYPAVAAEALHHENGRHASSSSNCPQVYCRCEGAVSRGIHEIGGVNKQFLSRTPPPRLCIMSVGLSLTWQGNTFMTIESDGHSLFTSVAWDLAHEQLVLADASGVVQVWNTYTESVRISSLRWCQERLSLETACMLEFSYTGPRPHVAHDFNY